MTIYDAEYLHVGIEVCVFAFTNHVVYHRGQINIALKMVGAQTDYAGYTEFIRSKE